MEAVVVLPQLLGASRVDDRLDGFGGAGGEYVALSGVADGDEREEPSDLPGSAGLFQRMPFAPGVRLDQRASFGAAPFGLDGVGAAPPCDGDAQVEPVSSPLSGGERFRRLPSGCLSRRFWILPRIDCVDFYRVSRRSG